MTKRPKRGQRQRGKSDFCLPDFSKTGRAALKVEQEVKKLGKCSTAATKNGARGLESRIKSQKIEKMFYRRHQKRGAASKVEQKSKKLRKCSTAATKNGACGLESRIKIQKIEKMFYRRHKKRGARPRK